MKKRIFFSTLFLFLLFFYSTLMIISLITLRDNFSAVKGKCLSEHYVIASALIGDMQALEGRNVDIADSIDRLMQTYSHYSQNRKNGLAVSCDGKWIYQSADLFTEIDLVKFAGQMNQQERIVYMENIPEPVLFIYGNFPAPFQDYGFMYSSDLSDTLHSWHKMKYTLYMIGMFVTYVLSVCLFIFLQRLFKPLRQISKVSAAIADGDYHNRLPVMGKDEVADMSRSFNSMAEQVETHIKLLQDTSDRKQQFIDNFAHELRTPLTAIYGYAEYMQKAPVSEKERYECTGFIMSECERLQHMAYQLLDLATMREVDMEDCSLKKIFTLSSRTMQVKAGEKNIRLVYQSDAETVWGNENLLLCLLNNLIDNAMKASKQGDSVHISAFGKAKHIIIEVKDYGHGMDNREIPHIKEAFYRVDKARSRAEGGAGLGLSICEQIAGLHHADLTFSSAPDKGTTARITF